MERKKLLMMKISSGPLQGLTDDAFRFSHHQVFGGIDNYFGPYVRLEENKETKKAQIKDTESLLNQAIPYIPQILSNDPALISKEISRLNQLGFQEINWNLGCPYPMVTKRKMGAGLLNQPTMVKDILSQISEDKLQHFSIKCRLGLENDGEIYPMMEVFNQFPLKELIIHVRTAKQMYKGIAQAEKILPFLPLSKHPIAYNGDLDSHSKIIEINELFQGKIQHFMIGRALLKNPTIALQAKGIVLSKEETKEKLIDFHQQLIEQYGTYLQGHQLLMKMRAFWEYFSFSFSDPHKVFKMIKKSKNWNEYENAVGQIYHQYLSLETNI